MSPDDIDCKLAQLGAWCLSELLGPVRYAIVDKAKQLGFSKGSAELQARLDALRAGEGADDEV